MGRVARNFALTFAAASLAFAPVTVQANTRPTNNPSFYLVTLSTKIGLPDAPESGKKRAGWRLISEDDLNSILLLAGGFTVAFALILADGQVLAGRQGESSSRSPQNQSNGAN